MNKKGKLLRLLILGGTTCFVQQLYSIDPKKPKPTIQKQKRVKKDGSNGHDLDKQPGIAVLEDEVNEVIAEIEAILETDEALQSKLDIIYVPTDINVSLDKYVFSKIISGGGEDEDKFLNARYHNPEELNSLFQKLLKKYPDFNSLIAAIEADLSRSFGNRDIVLCGNLGSNWNYIGRRTNDPNQDQELGKLYHKLKVKTQRLFNKILINHIKNYRDKKINKKGKTCPTS